MRGIHSVRRVRTHLAVHRLKKENIGGWHEKLGVTYVKDYLSPTLDKSLKRALNAFYALVAFTAANEYLILALVAYLNAYLLALASSL